MYSIHNNLRIILIIKQKLITIKTDTFTYLHNNNILTCVIGMD